MADRDYDSNYGNYNPTQPGGGKNAPTVDRSRKTVTAPCRPSGGGPDHINHGGNPHITKNPNMERGGRKYTGER